ncbi:MAG: hypothetical protein NVSMB57_03370 [Actinomycetota bacterium]
MSTNAPTIPTEAGLKELASFDGGDAPVLSLYLDVDGRRHPRRADFERTAADLLATACSNGSGRNARSSIERDVKRITDVVRSFDRSGVRGIAIFACGDALFQSFLLPFPVRTRIVCDRHPHLLRLESMLAKAERFCTVILSRESARVFTTQFGMTEQREEIADEVPNRHQQGGWSQANFQRHTDELAHRHFKHVSETLAANAKKESFQHLVLAGTDEVVTAFEKTLSQPLRDRLCERLSLPMYSTVTDVHTAVSEIEEKLETQHAQESVRHILDQFAAQRNAVVGIQPTLNALTENRVDVLAISDGHMIAGFRCSSCGRLSIASEQCPACEADVTPILDLHEEMVDEALRHGARVVATDTTRPLPDGVGALLRF